MVRQAQDRVVTEDQTGEMIALIEEMTEEVVVVETEGQLVVVEDQVDQVVAVEEDKRRIFKVIKFRQELMARSSKLKALKNVTTEKNKAQEVTENAG